MQQNHHFDHISRHLWSAEPLETTQRLLNGFEYSLLLDSDLRVRKTALFWVCMLVGRSRMVHMQSAASNKGLLQGTRSDPLKRPLRIPGKVCKGIIHFCFTGTREAQIIQKGLVDKHSYKRSKFTDKLLFIYAPVGSRELSFTGIIDITSLEKSIPIERLIDRMPDPLNSYVFSKWDVNLGEEDAVLFTPICKGEEEVPTCSGSSASSRSSSPNLYRFSEPLFSEENLPSLNKTEKQKNTNAPSSRLNAPSE